jgi:anti-sigma factor RsiW
MHPIDPAELSAYLDGELPPGRAEEVRTALARDPVLRETYEQLVALDADCKAKAAAALFTPRVQLRPSAVAGRYAAVAGVFGLLLIRLALKASPPLVGAAVAAILLAVLLGWGLRRLIRATDADWRLSVLSAGY